jgi:hypothetical protein
MEGLGPNPIARIELGAIQIFKLLFLSKNF